MRLFSTSYTWVRYSSHSSGCRCFNHRPRLCKPELLERSETLGQAGKVKHIKCRSLPETQVTTSPQPALDAFWHPDWTQRHLIWPQNSPVREKTFLLLPVLLRTHITTLRGSPSINRHRFLHRQYSSSSAPRPCQGSHHIQRTQMPSTVKTALRKVFLKDSTSTNLLMLKQIMTKATLAAPSLG